MPAGAPPQGDPAPAAAHGLRSAAAFLTQLGPAGPLAVIAATLPALGGFLLLGTLPWVGGWLRTHIELGLPLYVVGFILLAGLALLPTYAQALLGGWAFGPWLGIPAALAGFGGGALLAYAIARRAAGRRVVHLIEAHPKWHVVYKALLCGGFWKTFGIVALLRLPPNSPFALTNLVLATTRVAAGPYLLGTIIGMLPRTAAAVIVASHLATLDFGQARNMWLLVGGVVLTLIVLAIIGRVANRALARVTAASPDAAKSDPV